MNFATLLRTNVGALFALPLTLLSVFYVAANAHPVDPYQLLLTARGTATFGFVMPIVAALAAWEGGRLRRGNVWHTPLVRSRVVVAGWSVMPVVAAGWLAVLAGVMTSLVNAGQLVPDPRPLGVGFMVVAAHALASFAAGLWLPLAVSAASTLLASFSWMVFLRGLEPIWLRHLNGGALELCCGANQDLAPAAVLASAIPAVAMIGAVLIWLSSGSPMQASRVAASALLLGGLAGGTAFASQLESYPAQPRDPAALICSGSTVRVCLWPEHAPRIDEVVDLATAAVAGWRAAGIDQPSLVTEATSDLPEDAVSFGFSLTAPRAVVLNAIVYGMMPAWPRCADEGPHLGIGAFDYVQAWYAATAGMEHEDLARIFANHAPGAPPVLQVVERVRSLPLPQQHDWLQANLAALERCDLEPRLAISE
jgi:hypothetical protein